MELTFSARLRSSPAKTFAFTDDRAGYAVLNRKGMTELEHTWFKNNIF